MTEKLKPCPFCGGEAEISKGRFDDKDVSYVMCRKCAASGEFFFVSPKYASNERAIKAWNKRVNDYEEPSTEIVRCRDCVYKIFLQDEQIYKCKKTLHRFYDTDHFCSYGRRVNDENK